MRFDICGGADNRLFDLKANALNLYGVKVPSLKSLLPFLKKKLKELDISSRFVNQNFQNTNSAAIL